MKPSDDPAVLTVEGDVSDPRVPRRHTDSDECQGELESSPFVTGEILHIDGGQIADHC